MCTECGCIHENINVSDRVFNCPECGYSFDRDIHAAMNMVWLYKNTEIGMDCTEFKRADFHDWLNAKFGRLNHEDAVSLAQH